MLRLELPAFERVTVREADVSQLLPTERTADLVVVLEHQGNSPAAAIVVETQLGTDDDKKWSWPWYLTGLRAKLRCATHLLVVTTKTDVATWAKKPIPMGHHGFVLTPYVLGPEAIPIVRELAEAEQAPELAVLSAMAHGDDEPDVAVPIAVTALQACLGLDAERGLLYSDLVRVSLRGAAKTAFEKLMSQGNYQFQSDFARKHDALGRAHALIAVVEARGLTVSDEARARILGCADLSVLDRWIRMAVTIANADELFAE